MQIEGRAKERFLDEQPYKLSLWLNNPKHILMTKKVMQKLALSHPPWGGRGGYKKGAVGATALPPWRGGVDRGRVRGLQAGIKRGCGGCLGEKGERCGCPGEKPERKEGVQQSARRAGACGSPD